MMPELETEHEVVVDLFGNLGSTGKGPLGNEISDERVQQLIETVTEHMVQPDVDEPDTCMDDRGCGHLLNGENTRPRYKMAGGNLQTFYSAQRLIGNGHQLRTIKHEHSDLTVQEEKQEYQDAVIYRALGKRTGGHIAEHASGNDSGCAAADKEPEILQTIIEYGHLDDDPISDALTFFMRVDFDEKRHTDITVPQAEAYLSDLKRDSWVGRDLVNIIENPKPYDKVETNIGQEDIEVLVGEHNVDLAVINQTKKTIDRDFVKKVLWIDENRIWEESHEHGVDKAEAQALYQAAMTFNVASLFTLGSKDLRLAKIYS